MKKEELTTFIESIKRWQDGADVPVPQPKDLRIAYNAMSKLLEGISERETNEKLKGFDFVYFGKQKTGE